MKELFSCYFYILCVYLWWSVVAGYRSGKWIIKDIYGAAILTDASILQFEFASIPKI